MRASNATVVVRMRSKPACFGRQGRQESDSPGVRDHGVRGGGYGRSVLFERCRRFMESGKRGERRPACGGATDPRGVCLHPPPAPLVRSLPSKSSILEGCRNRQIGGSAVAQPGERPLPAVILHRTGPLSRDGRVRVPRPAQPSRPGSAGCRPRMCRPSSALPGSGPAAGGAGATRS